MPEKDLSFEEVNKHIESADLSTFKAGGKSHFAATDIAKAPGDVLQKICGIYKVVRPILVIVSNLPLIPQKWKDAIKTFINLMDGLCP